MKGNHSRMFILFRCSWGQGSRKCGFPKREGVPFRNQVCKEAGNMVLSVKLSFTACAVSDLGHATPPLGVCFFIYNMRPGVRCQWNYCLFLLLTKVFFFFLPMPFAWLIPAGCSGLRWNVSSELRPTLTTLTPGQVAFPSVCVALPVPGSHVPFWKHSCLAWLVTHLSVPLRW